MHRHGATEHWARHPKCYLLWSHKTCGSRVPPWSLGSQTRMFFPLEHWSSAPTIQIHGCSLHTNPWKPRDISAALGRLRPKGEIHFQLWLSLLCVDRERSLLVRGYWWHWTERKRKVKARHHPWSPRHQPDSCFLVVSALYLGTNV
jgi:hypothetical protein